MSWLTGKFVILNHIWRAWEKPQLDTLTRMTHTSMMTVVEFLSSIVKIQ